jgi:thiol:disulfide interchange protein DsbC
MPKKIVSIIAALSVLASGAALANEALKKTLQAKVPELTIESVSKSPLPGLYEVVARVDGDTMLFYADEKGQYLIVAERVLDLDAKKNILEERVNRLTGIRFDALPLDMAFKSVKGNGKRRLAVFSDPDCPYCRRLEQDLKKLNDVTVYTFLLPIEQLHPAATEKARQVWCSADRQKTWDDLMLNNVSPTGAKSCENPVDKIVAFAEQKRINATPTMILADGTRVSGAKSAGELDRLMNEAEARCAKEGKALC